MSHLENISFFILFLLYTQIVSSQISFKSQEDIDIYPSTCVSCDCIDSDIIINGKILNFDSLSIVKKIRGTIFIQEIDTAVDWTGFNNVETISGPIIGFGIESPFTLNGFENLKSIGGINLTELSGLDSITGFQNLEEINGLLRIRDCDLLNEVNGFNLVKRAGDLQILKNDTLHLVSGFNSLKHAKSLFIGENHNLKIVHLDSDLDSIENGLSIGIHFNLESITGFNKIRYIGGPLSIASNHSLKYLNGFGKLEECYRFNIVTNKKLEEIPDFPKLKNVYNDFFVEGLDRLKEINGFNNLERVDNRFLIIRMDSIESIAGFNSLIGSEGFYLESLPIRNIEGFHSLSKIGKRLSIVFTHLTNLSFLSSTTSIANTFIIHGNWSLNDLSNLDQLDHSNLELLSIKDNRDLSICHQKWVCDYIRAGNGITTIENNLTGCNSIEEVLAGCLVDVDEQVLDVTMISPNPTSGYLQLRGEFPITQVHIFDYLGREVLTAIPQGNKIDVHSLMKGAYILQIETPSNALGVVKKFIKL